MKTEIEAALAPLGTTDPFLIRVIEKMTPLIEGTDAAEKLERVQLHVVDFREASKEVLKGRYFTENCAAMIHEQAVIINEAYLLETEAAMRSFGLAGELLSVPYLRSDEDLFGLVERVRSDPSGYVNRLRALDRLPGRENAEAEAIDSFAMLLMFLIGHELGHLDQGHDQRAFGAYVDPKAPLEAKLGNAVVKLARHARELDRLGFNLPGFEKSIDESSEIGANEKHWREVLKEVQVNQQKWFQDESAADDHATVLVQQVLDGVAKSDPARADVLLISAVNTLFAAAIYHWQRDLGVFLNKLGLERLPNAQELSMTMMRSRETYIHAAELFGEVHRFTLLRAILAINGWLHARGVLKEILDKPVKRIEKGADRPAMDETLAAGCRQRELLLRIHADTAVKIANQGAATGWILDKDKARGTQQVFLMNFESIRQSVGRLQRMM